MRDKEEDLQICDKLIESHKSGRAHLRKLLSGINEEMWFQMPAEGRWSIQRATTHIINAELMWFSMPTNEQPEYLKKDASIQDFHNIEKQVAESLYKKLRKEVEDMGLMWSPPEDDISYLWAMSRIMEHTVYHTGMISLLRQQIGAPELGDVGTWAPMVDSILGSMFN